MALTEHNTFVLRRQYPRASGVVFEAFRDPRKKQAWYAANEAHDVKTYDMRFEVGGNETLVAVMRPGTPIAGAKLTWSQTFLDIVDEQRIVFTQTVDMNGHRISCALVTVTFTSNASGCALELTHQAAFFEGADGAQIRQLGWHALLDAIASAID